MYFLVFHGKERFDQNPDAHHDDHAAHDDHHGAHDDHGHGHDAHAHVPHESPWVVWVPLVLLAIPSVLIGYLTIDYMLFGDFFKGAIFIDLEKHAAMEELKSAFHGPSAMALHALTSPPLWLAIAGVALSYYMYMINPAVPAAIKRAASPIYTLLENKYYMDWFNENVLARGARALGVGLWKGGDQAVIDGTVVNGSWKVVGWIASGVRQVQSGYLYHYALVMLLGIFVLMSFFVVWLN
jgi:NADH-quinone oxidoreductase subunit L